MSGVGGGTPSDPEGQREKAVEAMANWLIENALDHCKHTRHQVGVISFGDGAQIDLPFTEIAPKSFDAAVQLQRKLEERIHATALGNTLPFKAFELARKMFDESPLRNVGVRKQVIVMLTDGLISDGINRDGFVKPTQEFENYINETFPVDPTLKEREECIQSLVINSGSFDDVPYEQINSCLQAHDVSESAYLNSTYLHIVLMNYADEKWPSDNKIIYDRIAKEHMGRFMDFQDTKSENRNEIPDYFRTILSELVGVPSGRVECGPVAVNAFLDKATFVFYKFSADTQVKLRYQDAKGKNFEISGNVANDPSGFDIIEYEAYGPNERYTINKPYPGIWYIESDRCASNGVSAFYQEVKINPGGYNLPITTIQQYDLEPYYDESAPHYLSYEMWDETGELVQISPNPFFEINTLATVMDPSGSAKEYQLFWNANENKFLASEPLDVRLKGDYSVSIIGKAPYYPGNKAPVTGSLATTFNTDLTLFQHENLGFKVTEVKPFVIVPDKPQPGDVGDRIHETISMGWPLKIMPIDFSAKVAWKEGPLDVALSEIFTEPEHAYQAWIEFEDGETTEPVFLQLDPDDPAKLFTTFENIDTEEQLLFHVELVGEPDTEYRPDVRHIQVPFSRTETKPLGKPGTYKMIVLILTLISLLIALSQLFVHYDPVTGTLVFIEEGNEMSSLGIYTRKKVTKLKRNDIRDFDLKKLEVSYTPYIKSDYEYDEETSRSVSLKGKTECGQDFKFELENGSSNHYCLDHMEFEVQYKNSEPATKPKLQPGAYLIVFLIPAILAFIFFTM